MTLAALDQSNNEKIWLSPPHMSGRELPYVNEAFATNWIAPIGPHVNAFEKELAATVEVAHATALSSGTAAIHLALRILGVGREDTVLVSTFTFAASANPIVDLGATPFFVESEEDTWNISPQFLEEAIAQLAAKGTKPKALVLVHLYGMPAKMKELLEICNAHDIPVVEDAAEALGSSYFGRKLGSFGHSSIVSLNGNKIITCSGGGALLSDNPEITEKAKFFATQARDAAPHYQHSETGHNYRLSNVLAGIARGQLEVLRDRVQQRRSIHDYYQQRLSSLDAVSFLEEPEGFFSNRWLTTILIDPAKGNRATREDVRLTLDGYNIESRPLWKPLHMQPVFEGLPYVGDHLSAKLFARGLCLPSGSAMTEGDLDRICTIIESTLA